MGVVNIPNQPIQFDTNAVSSMNGCLNNDDRAYAPLMQGSDVMQLQMINTPCGDFLNCDWSSLSDQVDEGELSQTLLGGIWFEWDTTTGTNLGIPTYWTAGALGASNDPTNINIGLAQVLPGTPGDIYLITFEANFNAPNMAFRVGFVDTVGNTYNDTLITNYIAGDNEPNIDGRYSIIVGSLVGSPPTIIFSGRGVLASDFTINNVKAYNLTAGGICYVPNNAITIGEFWQYVESVNGFQLMNYNASNNNITTSGSVSLAGNYKITFSIMNSTDGEVYFNNSAGIKYVASGNGDYTIYYNHAPPTGPLSWTCNSLFDGIIYNIRIQEMCYFHTFEILNVNGAVITKPYDSLSSTYPVTYDLDRIIWKFNLADLISPANTPFAAKDGCYYVRVTDCCTSVSTVSTTFINYTQGTWDCSYWVEADNDGFAFDFFFKTFNGKTTFQLVQRLRVLQFNPIYPAVSEEYLFSNGARRRSFAQSSKIRTAWFDYVDELTHDIIRIQVLSDTFKINNNEFFCVAEDYEPEWGQNGKYNLAQSRVNLIDVNEPTLYNKSC